MSEIVLLHSALGLNAGITAVAARFEAAGHTVRTPDYYAGRTFTTTEAAVAYRDQVGFPVLYERAQAQCTSYGEELVFAGLSLGAALAQQMGKNDPRARGVLLFHGGGFAQPTRWSERVPVQIHFSVDDEWRETGAPEALLESAARAGASAEYHLYPGDSHLFSDPTSADFVPASADLLYERAAGFLSRLAAR